ncbi:hypothetical protein BKA67DRAFT_541405 [Truncatella angustata]|uniref:Uncharacterized protein n=1 Tax=Truncatella angustata TaxID=152316 RepID=A0A9P8RIE0_9PEZI|nr:uncharacterized protein BKA67DRAFT_541405 [Truncatella angustata]KAH6646437.1 hypothetical protein BKA67DRAFT_541405 [Truncatella angustata]
MDGLSRDEMAVRWDDIIDSGGKCSAEEYGLIRKMIAASLAQNLGSQQIHHPLSLVDPTTLQPSDSEELTGVQADYLNGIKRYAQGQTIFSNFAAQQKVLAQKVQEQKRAKERERALDQEILALQLETAKLQKEHDQRRTFIKHLGELEKMPAAQPDFLNSDIMYEDCSPMPEMPKEMIDGFATDHSAVNAQAEELLQNLKKHVLRSKLMSQRQQADYERSQAEKPIDVNSLSPEVKLYALNAVKNALINWVEAQLAKAGDDGSEAHVEEGTASAQVEYDHDGMLSEIQQKYQRHIELRQSLLNQLAQLDQVKENLKATATTVESPKTQHQASAEKAPLPTNVPDTYLLTPYIERLQTLARQQKSMVQEKSYINGSLAKQQQETRQILDRLAEESQLLSKFPVVNEPSKSELSFDDRTKITDEIKPWLHAADSAKLATLVEVAESVEIGMESIDEAIVRLEQACKLFNVPFPQGGEELKQEDGVEDSTKVARSPKKEPAKKIDEVKTIWDILDGNLGSINELDLRHEM